KAGSGHQSQKIEGRLNLPVDYKIERFLQPKKRKLKIDLFIYIYIDSKCFFLIVAQTFSLRPCARAARGLGGRNRQAFLCRGTRHIFKDTSLLPGPELIPLLSPLDISLSYQRLGWLLSRCSKEVASDSAPTFRSRDLVSLRGWYMCGGRISL